MSNFSAAEEKLARLIDILRRQVETLEGNYGSQACGGFLREIHAAILEDK